MKSPIKFNSLQERIDYKKKEALKFQQTRDIVDESDRSISSLSLAMLISLIAILIIIFGTSIAAHAEEYTNDQIVSAIYKAEGGDHAQYPYGIRSVNCESRSDCARVCKNTVRNNRERFKKYGYKSYPDFLSFLASRYCPIKADNDPKGLNKNWLKNVKFYLAKGE